MEQKPDIKEDELLTHILSEWKTAMSVLEGHLVRPFPGFPFHSTTDNRRLEKLDLVCTACGSILVDPRGEVSEKFGTIEADLYGFCINCYKDDHHIIRWHKEGNWSCKIDGEWYEINMKMQKPSKIKRIFNMFKRGKK